MPYIVAMPKQSVARARNVATVFDELTAITRRTAARFRRGAAPLSFVDHSMLSFIVHTPRCRATDIAAGFHLNRSTVSRQLAELLELGLVDYAPEDGLPGRGRVLQVTPEGRQQLANSAEAQRRALQQRLEDWSDAEIAALAELLTRFNATEAL